MSLGSSLFQGRKQSGMSQEAVAEKLGVSRQTVSKWETDETLPDIRQAKRLAMLYGLTLDELIDFDLDVQELEQVVRNTSTRCWPPTGRRWTWTSTRRRCGNCCASSARTTDTASWTRFWCSRTFWRGSGPDIQSSNRKRTAKRPPFSAIRTSVK